MNLRSAMVGALGALLLNSWLGGCSRPLATPDDCREILDRIVELELRERGLRDPLLTERRQKQYRSLFATELKACPGKPLDPEAMPCVRRAQNVKELVHSCLR